MKKNFLINFFISIKKLKIYKFILKYFVKFFYDFIWEYIVNFYGKILYFLWFSKKRDFIDLGSNDKKLVQNNLEFKALAKKIYDYADKNIIEKSRAELSSGNISRGNPTNSGVYTYSQGIFNRLSLDLQKEIFSLAHSDLLISTVSKYLKVFPILDKVIVGHNIPSQPDKVRGAMLWHKDDFGYRSMDLFMAISDIDKQNGPLKAVIKKSELGIFSKSNEENKHQNMTGERGKIGTNHFENLNSNNVAILEGEKGTGLFVDSFTVYHRGGHCLSKDRLMLRFSYQTPDSIRVERLGNGFSVEYKNLKNSFPKNKFLKYLYEKRPSKFMVFFRKYLLKFYRFAHVKEN